MKDYPKIRKCPENSDKAQLIRKHGLDYLKTIWVENGMYKSAEILKTSPSVIRYIALINAWKRPLPKHLEIAFNRGNWKTLITNIKPESKKCTSTEKA
jgi:hypothetical protein